MTLNTTGRFIGSGFKVHEHVILYPQVGGGDLHIAHVLWGGLLLYPAALLTLIFASRRIYTISALLASAGLLTAKQNRLGTAVGNVGLFMSLTTMNVLLFYFEQFSTLITAAIQFLLIIGIIVYRRRAGPF